MYYGGDSDRGLLTKYTVKVLHFISGSSQTSPTVSVLLLMFTIEDGSFLV